MLSLFSIPKPFTGYLGTIQHNALGSWTRLGCEVVLFGDDDGVAEAAARHGVRHEPAIARNEFGTPVLSEVFSRMDAVAQYPLVGFINADIILLGDFLPSVRAVAQSHEQFVVIASRFNSRIEQPLPFEPGWESALRAQVRREHRGLPTEGSDLFVYPRGLYRSVPPFAIGRGYWDNWLMREARRLQARLVDATAALTAVHQEHTYDHVPGVSAGAGDRHVYETDEGRRNLALAGGHGRLYTGFDASDVLTADGRVLSTWRIPLVRRRIKSSLRRAARTLAASPLAARTLIRGGGG